MIEYVLFWLAGLVVLVGAVLLAGLLYIMSFDEQPDGDPHGECAAEIAKLRNALLRCARMAEALKRPCSEDPESTQAVRNAQYQAISTTAHVALGTIKGAA